MPRVGARNVRTLFAHPESGLLVLIAAACLGFSLADSSFATAANAQAIARASAFVGVIAVGQTFLLVAGEFDLSVGSVSALGAIVWAYLMTSGGLPWPVAMLVALAVGAAIGVVNGTLTAVAGIPALVVTLGMLYVARGASLVVSDGNPITRFPDAVRTLGRAEPLGLPVAVWIFIGVTLAGDFVLRRSTYGRRLYATGGNRRAALLIGIDPVRAKISAFALVGVLASLAGMLLASRLGTADPSSGQGTELLVIAGAVVGGVSLFGGAGSVLGAFLGVVFLQVLVTGLVVVGVEASLQPVATGVILIVAIALDGWRRRRLETAS